MLAWVAGFAAVMALLEADGVNVSYVDVTLRVQRAALEDARRWVAKIRAVERILNAQRIRAKNYYRILEG